MVIGPIYSIGGMKKFAMINKDFDTKSKYSNIFPIFLILFLNIGKVQ